MLLACLGLATTAISKAQAPPGGKEPLIDPASLSQAFETIASQESGDFGIYCSVQETGEEAGYQQDKPFVAASCYKLFLVMYVYESAAAGQVDLDQVIVYSSSDTTDGTGAIQFMPVGTPFTVRQLCKYAITHSDNIAARMLRRTFGYEAYRDYAGSLGCPVSSVPDGRNYTTARELGVVLRRIVDFAAGNSLGQEVIQFLKDDIYRSRIPAGVPSGVPVGNKVGDYEGYANDAAIIFTEDTPYFLVVLSSGAAGDTCHILASRYTYSYVSSRLCTGGHCLAGITSPARQWYFAEGYTGDGFQTWLCLQNPGTTTATVQVEYFTQEAGALPPRSVDVPPASRLTLFVNTHAGAGLQLATRLTVTAGPDIVAERPMYFRYRDTWTGGHVAAGTTAPTASCYFAEGYTGPGFEEWITVFNPSDTTADLDFHFQTQEQGELVREGYSVAPGSRASFNVNELAGADLQLSLALQASAPIVAERSMYFDYVGGGQHDWTGGHCVAGSSSLVNRCYFAEGTTREGFDEWLTLQNPSTEPITITATYYFTSGSLPSVTRDYVVEQGKRRTVYVPGEVGAGLDVSVMLSSPTPFAAERPIYFYYQGYGAYWSGGHCVAGVPAPANDAYFAEGYTGPGFQEWLCLFNPGDEAASLEITYQVQGSGALPPRTVDVAPRSRLTLRVNDHAGSGLQLSTRVKVVTGPPVLAERPIYFNYSGFITP